MKDGRFVFHAGDDSEDLRVIIKLKGKFRLDKDKLYFTIISKTVLEGGEIGIGDSIDGNIFSIQNADIKEILMSNPKESDVCWIKVYSPVHIKIINVDYYKIDQVKYKIDKDEVDQ